MSPFSKTRPFEETPAAARAVRHQRLGAGGGLRESLPPGTRSALSLPFARRDLIFRDFKFSRVVTLGEKEKINKGYAVYIPQTPNPEVRVSPG